MNQKIAFIASCPGSLTNFRLHLMKEFLNKGFSVVAMAPYDEKVMAELSDIGIEYNTVPLERNGNNPLKDLKFFLKLFFLMRKEKPDFVFSYTIKPVIYGTLAAKLARVPNVYSMLTGTGYIFSNTNFKNRIVGLIAKNMFKISLKFNKKLFFQNKDNVATFIDYKLINKSQALAIINGSGVDINFFTPAPFPKKISFLMVARLINDKGIREYLEAARIIKKRYPEVEIKLVGAIDTNPNSISEKELTQWIQLGFIEYLGWLSDVRVAISDSSIFVLPSYGEGTPRTVLEAMAMNRPIITTDVPGCRETVINNENGFLVPARDVDALCTAMEYFILNSNDIEKMGDKSRKIAVKKYDVHKVNKCILNEMGIEGV